MFFAMCIVYSLSSQEYLQSTLKTTDPSKCYVESIIPDEYEEESSKVMTFPEYKWIEIIPAKFKIIKDKIVIRPQSKSYKYIPAVYETIIDTIWIEESYNELSIEPAEFVIEQIEIEIKPQTGVWVAGELDPDCFSVDPSDCRIFHFVETPPVVQSIPVERLKKNETTKSKKIEGVYRLIKRHVETRPAKIIEKIIPEKIEVVSRKVVESVESKREKIVPAQYKEILKRNLIKHGGMISLREIPCDLPEKGKYLPIKYRPGSIGINSDAIKDIDQYILTSMLNNKEINVEIGSHTDSKGDDELNKKLSQARAKAIVEYLILKGIDKSRLIAVGYGKEKPLYDCVNYSACSESLHEQNRRIEFKFF